MAFEDNGEYETNNPWSFGSWDQWFIPIVAIVLIVVLGYVVYDVVKSTAAEMLQSLLMISPLILIIVVHWLSTPDRFSIPMPGSEPGAIHRAGASPWGLTVILALLVFLISYQPSLHGFLF
nr:transmembrane protein [Tanacetum cinerariifolium]